MAKPFFIPLCAALLFAGCVSSDRLYYHKITGGFDNGTFAYYKENYPFIIDVKGSQNETERVKVIDQAIKTLTDHPRLVGASLYSASRYKQADGDEVRLVLHVNGPAKANGRLACGNDIALFEEGKTIENIESLTLSFCRKDKVKTYAKGGFTEPVSYTSDSFSTLLNRSAQTILFRKNENKSPTTCNIIPC